MEHGSNGSQLAPMVDRTTAADAGGAVLPLTPRPGPVL